MISRSYRFLSLAFSVLAVLRGLPAYADPFWTSHGPPATLVLQIVTDPRAPQTLYLLTNGGIAKTEDSGEHWKVGMLGLPSVGRIAIDPTNSSNLFATNPLCLPSGAPCAGVYRSTDGGAAWAPQSIGLPAEFPNDIVFSPGQPGTAYALYAFRGLYRTMNSGAEWAAVSLPPGIASEANCIGVAPAAADTLFLGLGSGGLARSRNQGASWTTVGVGQVGQTQSIVIDPVDPTIIYAVGFSEIFRSDDGGDSWVERGSGQALALAIDPANHSTLYAGANDGVWKSVDDGKSWSRAGVGLSSCFPVPALAISVAPAEIVFAGTPGDGLLQSSDGGETWQHNDRGLPRFGLGALATAPSDPETVYSVGSVVFRSSNAGATWREGCLPGTGIAQLVVDPFSPVTLFGASNDGCEFGFLCSGAINRSMDGGLTWDQLLPTGAVTAIQVDPRQPGVLYAGISEGSGNPDTGGDILRNASLFKSVDAGVTWNPLSLENLNTDFLEIQVDPKDSRTVYAAASLLLDAGPPDVGIWRSADEGASWTKRTDLDVNVFAIDPNATETLYAGTSQGVMRSANGALNWAPTAFTQPVSALVMDPEAPDTLYIGTVNDGVYSSGDGGASWIAFNEGLTDLQVTALAIDSRGLFLHTVTKTGGVFDLPIPRARSTVRALKSKATPKPIAPR